MSANASGRKDVLHTVHGQPMTVAEAAERTGISRATLWSRMKRGRTLEESIDFVPRPPTPGPRTHRDPADRAPRARNHGGDPVAIKRRLDVEAAQARQAVWREEREAWA